MVMNCSAYLRPPQEQRKSYINRRLEEVMEWYRVPDDMKEQFLKTPEIREIKEALMSIDMTLAQITDFLDEAFKLEWGKDG